MEMIKPISSPVQHTTINTIVEAEEGSPWRNFSLFSAAPIVTSNKTVSFLGNRLNS